MPPSNAWGVNLSDAGEITQTLNGDYSVASTTHTGAPLTRVRSDGSIITVVASGEQRYLRDGQGNLLAGGDTLVTDNVIFGSAANDKINGGVGNDQIDGGAGGDMIGGKTRVRTVMRRRRACVKKNSYSSNRYEGYCLIPYIRNPESSGCASRLAASLKSAAGTAVQP